MRARARRLLVILILCQKCCLDTYYPNYNMLYHLYTIYKFNFLKNEVLLKQCFSFPFGLRSPKKVPPFYYFLERLVRKTCSLIARLASIPSIPSARVVRKTPLKAFMYAPMTSFFQPCGKL